MRLARQGKGHICKDAVQKNLLKDSENWVVKLIMILAQPFADISRELEDSFSFFQINIPIVEFIEIITADVIEKNNKINTYMDNAGGIRREKI